MLSHPWGSFNTGTAQQHLRLTCCPAGWRAGMSRNRALWPTDARQRTLWSVPRPASHPTKNQGHGRWDRLPHSFTRAWSAQTQSRFPRGGVGAAAGRRDRERRRVQTSLLPTSPPSSLLPRFLPHSFLTTHLPRPKRWEHLCPISPKCSLSPRTRLSSKIPLLTPSSTSPLLGLLFPFSSFSSTPFPTLVTGTPVSCPPHNQLCTHPPRNSTPSHGLSLGLSPASPIWLMGLEQFTNREDLKSNLNPHSDPGSKVGLSLPLLHT